MTRGGKRTGAGRKKGFAAFEAEKAREYIAQQVSARLERIVKALIERAEKGDVRTAQILFDRAWGKVLQAIDIKETIVQGEPVTEIHYVLPRDMKVSVKTV